MADTDDTTSDTTPGTPDQQVAEPQDTTPPDIPAGEPAPDEEPTEEPAEDSAEPVAELRADAATLEAAAIPPTRAPAEDAEAPRFGAQFSSPEPTTVTARPRRRATRHAPSADPDSVEPAPAAPPVHPDV
ncbi:ribonuclease E/G, partial [Klenkia sp. PcliD-1-E]|nr:ribonuclease E/G [Klenkia sp. PcliD-1-E]